MMNYQLLGADGGSYRLAQQDRVHAARVHGLSRRQESSVGQVRVWLRRHLRVLMASTPHAGGRTESGGLCGPGRSGHETRSAGWLRLDDAQFAAAAAAVAGRAGVARVAVEPQRRAPGGFGRRWLAWRCSAPVWKRPSRRGTMKALAMLIQAACAAAFGLAAIWLLGAGLGAAAAGR